MNKLIAIYHIESEDIEYTVTEEEFEKSRRADETDEEVRHRLFILLKQSKHRGDKNGHWRKV